jgi:pimeloyl-ACP methyl ester carboxylesterase
MHAQQCRADRSLRAVNVPLLVEVTMTPALLLLLALQISDPVERRIQVAPAETLHVSISGDGDPVVIVPGLLGAGFGFRKVAPLLGEAGYRTHVFDLLGTGNSARPRDADYSLNAQADRIAAALDSLRVGGAIVIAHAIGGSVAMRLAVRRPDLVGGLVLVEAGPAESSTSPGLRRALGLSPLIRLLGAGRIRDRIRDQMVEASGSPEWVDSVAIEGYTADSSRDLGAVLRTLKAMADAREQGSLAADLPAISSPVLLLLGGTDHAGAPPAAEIEVMARALPLFAADTLAGVGHFPHEEAPESVRDAVLRVHRVSLVAAPARPAG